MSDTAKYVVISKFAKFKVGQVVELSVPCPSAAHAHVKLHVEQEVEVDSSEGEAMTALGELYTLHTGDKAGKKGVKTLKEAIIKSIDEIQKSEYIEDEVKEKQPEAE